MQTFTIHTWRCSGCGYAQDFDPAEKGCRSCLAKDLMVKETDPAMKSKMNVPEKVDLDQEVASLNEEPLRKNKTGFKEIRQETEEERILRVSKLALADDEPAITREFHILKEESSSERKKRISDRKKSLKVPTAKQLADLRAKYEDK